MRMSYSLLQPDEKSLDVGCEVASLLISKGLSYKQASDALDYAQEVLFTNAKATMIFTPQQAD